MATSRRARALEKLHAVDTELFENIVEEVEQSEKTRTKIRVTLITLLVLSGLLLFYLIATGRVELLYDHTPTDIHFLRADTNDSDELRIFVGIPEFDPFMIYRSYDRVKAELFVADSKEAIRGEVIPVFRNKSSVEFLALFRNFKVAPGVCDAVLRFDGWTKKSNEIEVKWLNER